jgi:hypothetical protein
VNPYNQFVQTTVIRADLADLLRIDYERIWVQRSYCGTSVGVSVFHASMREVHNAICFLGQKRPEGVTFSIEGRPDGEYSRVTIYPGLDEVSELHRAMDQERHRHFAESFRMSPDRFKALYLDL